MKIIVDVSCDEPSWPEETVMQLATFALTHESAPEVCELSISLITEEEIAQLNEEYRDKQGPTDVLSFPLDDPWQATKDAKEILIGDIMIAPTVAATQAPQYGNSFEEEMSLLLVHGCLHLLGYDHIDEDEALEMEAHEREILSAWKERDK